MKQLNRNRNQKENIEKEEKRKQDTLTDQKREKK